ncbi:hypothetical protein ACIG0D_32235 [Streptomyces sp. NPDC052773]|uniref:SCO2102 family sporulation regulator n=1 Tax=Streptomyces sp. NPDC052773 TaxID=3365693 RepID=UPI0037D34886
MGWTVLYIAFGIVALWLLGEVLLQYKARLRWRLLAFVGFLGVVVGVLIPSVVVIGLGAAAFAVGQTYVTLSFRRGFAAGWAVTTRPVLGGGKRNRRDRQDPTLEVSDLQAGEYADTTQRDEDGSYGDDPDRDDVFTPARPATAPTAAETTAVYEPQPLPDETGSYGVYAQDQYAATAQTADQGYGYDGYAYPQQYGYDTAGQQQYAAYSDPYIGTQTYSGAAYDPAYDTQYGQQAYAQDQYTGGYGGETPSGGVWVPQQRTTDDPYGGDLPPEQPYGYPGDGQAQGQGYDERYRF